MSYSTHDETLKVVVVVVGDKVKGSLFNGDITPLLKKENFVIFVSKLED